MIKAVFIDFYGTLVYEDGENVERISREIYRTGKAQSVGEVDSYWWKCFQASFQAAYGDKFETQRSLELQSLQNTVEHFASTADAEKMSEEMFSYWVKPGIFEESKEFMEKCPLPVYIVSNIDRDDIEKAISYHELKPDGVFTSEDARSYKPRKELFELALNATGLHADEVIHIGDSLSSDVAGAGALGISAIWINRSGKPISEKVQAVGNLLEILELNYFKQ